MKRVITQAEAPEFIRELRPFIASGLSGVDGGVSGVGYLPGPDAYAYAGDVHRGLVRYTILSYATPIAWRRTSGEWVMPRYRYSPTTTQHQHIAAHAIDLTWRSTETERVTIDATPRRGW